MTDKEFKNLKLEIEKKMVELRMLQKKFNKETGQNHVMPLYLETPDHLKDI